MARRCRRCGREGRRFRVEVWEGGEATPFYLCRDCLLELGKLLRPGRARPVEGQGPFGVAFEAGPGWAALSFYSPARRLLDGLGAVRTAWGFPVYYSAARLSDLKSFLPDPDPLERLARAGLPEAVRRRAEELYSKFRDSYRQFGLRAFLTACAYLACRAEGLAFRFEEIAFKLGADVSKARRCYRALRRELKLYPPPPGPEAFVRRLAGKLRVPEDVEEEAVRLAGSLPWRGDGALAAGACLLEAARRAGLKLGLKRVAAALFVSENSLRAKLRELREKGEGRGL